MNFEFSDDAILVSFVLTTGFFGLTAVISETFGGPPEPAVYAPMMLAIIAVVWIVLGVLEWVWNLITGSIEETDDDPEPADYPATDGGHDGEA